MATSAFVIIPGLIKLAITPTIEEAAIVSKTVAKPSFCSLLNRIFSLDLLLMLVVCKFNIQEHFVFASVPQNRFQKNLINQTPLPTGLHLFAFAAIC